MCYIERDERYSKRGFAANMERIDKFCKKNNIIHSSSSDSYYFSVNGIKYRVSTHTVDESNAGAFDENGKQWRELYHNDFDCNGRINIIAGKNKIIDIYKSIVSGKSLCDAY